MVTNTKSLKCRIAKLNETICQQKPTTATTKPNPIEPTKMKEKEKRSSNILFFGFEENKSQHDETDFDLKKPNK